MNQLKGIVRFINANSTRILVLAWLLVQVILFIMFGVFEQEEAVKYISQARIFLESGRLSTTNFWFYFTEIFLIAIAIKTKLGYFLVIIIQMLLNAMATRSLYKLALHILKDSFLSFILVLLFIGSIFYQTYNVFLYTESCFYSLSIIFSSYLLRLQQFSWKQAIIILLLIFLLSVTRPTGILFLPVAVIYLFLHFFKRIRLRIKLLMISLATIFFFFVLNIITQSGGELDFMLPFRDERIICGVPTIEELPINTTANGNSLAGILYYITHNTGQFIRLGWLKTRAFFGLTRSYFSTVHNLYLVLFYYPFYFLIILFLIRFYKKINMAHLYLFMIVAVFWLTTVLTCDDWHNRFYLTITPYLFILGFSALAQNKVTQ